MKNAEFKQSLNLSLREILRLSALLHPADGKRDALHDTHAAALERHYATARRACLSLDMPNAAKELAEFESLTSEKIMSHDAGQVMLNRLRSHVSHIMNVASLSGFQKQIHRHRASAH